MAVTQTQETSKYLARFAELEHATSKDQAWLTPIRKAAILRFSELGFPSVRDEDWRFTSVAPISRTDFQVAPDARAEVSPDSLSPFTVPGMPCTALVFVNGRFAPRLSSLHALPKGVKVTSLGQAMAEDRASLEPHLARYADFHQDAFSALNTAFMEDGAFISIPRGVVLEEPIHLLYVSTDAAFPTVTYPRNLIVMGENTQASVVEDYGSLGDGVAFSNAITELVVGGNSVASHYLIERENTHSFNVSTLRVEQGRSSNVTSHSVLLGGALVRNNIHPVLAGEGCECVINGLFVPTGRQHMDNYMKVEHSSPHGASRQFYKGILDGQSRGVFHGRIIVHKDAQKTDAKQTNMNLLLSEDAQIDTKPQLEIYADDVKCTHGATIGQIDDEAIFYLRSRGIAEAPAKALLLFAFAQESLQRMKIAPLRKYLEGLVTEWLPQAKPLEDVR
ncbi:MAG TPA: Fe-S cluster assembly protein SufD [Candidatus Methylomirabilis sp.]|nr:Fe-S cluster assembly protein SufD [Candidatus Methylomirabilis sp.]